jgi:transposase
VHYITYLPYVTLPFDIDPERDIPKTDSFWLVKEFVHDHLFVKGTFDISLWNETYFSSVAMLDAILLTFSLHGYCSYREISECAKYDIRVMAFFNGHKVPSHSTSKNTLIPSLRGEANHFLSS